MKMIGLDIVKCLRGKAEIYVSMKKWMVKPKRARSKGGICITVYECPRRFGRFMKRRKDADFCEDEGVLQGFSVNVCGVGLSMLCAVVLNKLVSLLTIC